MHRTLLAAGVLVGLFGCGSDSGTGPNPNPNAKNYTISINGSAVDPDSLDVLIGDTVTWRVAPGDPGRHQIRFIELPPGTQQSPSRVLAAGEHAFTVFLRDGRYTYQDDSTGTHGIVMVKPLP